MKSFTNCDNSVSDTDKNLIPHKYVAYAGFLLRKKIGNGTLFWPSTFLALVETVAVFL